MRAFVGRAVRVATRVLAGWTLVAGGVLALTGAVVMGVAGGHRAGPGAAGAGAEPAFTAPLTTVHTEGHAIVVPDVGALLSRHGIARLLGDGVLTVTVRSTSIPSPDLVAALVPVADAVRHYSGTAHAEVLAVGYAAGAQPAQVVDRPGTGLRGQAPWESGPGSGAREVQLSLEVPTREPVALVVRRVDQGAGLAVTITAGFAPASWGLATVLLWIGGLLATIAGLALLLVRRPTVELVPGDLAELDELLPPARRISPYVYTAT